jgi:2-iminobutanoate/2-iminopropanoate deaminase
MSDQRHWRPARTAPDAPPAAGAYSPAVRAGDFIFVSGQVPKDAATGRIEGDVAHQTRVVLANLGAVLAAEGATLNDVVSVTAYLADIGEWDAFNAAYSQVFGAPYPARTTLGAGLHGFKVEINAVAYVGRSA